MSAGQKSLIYDSKTVRKPELQRSDPLAAGAKHFNFHIRITCNIFFQTFPALKRYQNYDENFLQTCFLMYFEPLNRMNLSDCTDKVKKKSY